MAMGLEMVDPNLKWNLGTCLGIVWTKDGADEAVHDALSKIFEEWVGFQYNEITHTTTSDIASKGIANVFNHDEYFCHVRYCDKIGRWDIEDLLRTRSEVQCFLIFA